MIEETARNALILGLGWGFAITFSAYLVGIPFKYFFRWITKG